MAMRYYYLDHSSRTIYYSETEISDRPELIPMGISQNPNPKSAVSSFVQNDLLKTGYKILPLP